MDRPNLSVRKRTVLNFCLAKYDWSYVDISQTSTRDFCPKANVPRDWKVDLWEILS